MAVEQHCGEKDEATAGQGENAAPIGWAGQNDPVDELVASLKLHQTARHEAAHAVGVDVEGKAIVWTKAAFLPERFAQSSRRLPHAGAKALVVPGQKVVIGCYLLLEIGRESLHHPAGVGIKAMNKERDALPALQLLALHRAIGGPAFARLGAAQAGERRRYP